MIRHHPDEGLLLAYASGVADEAMSLILATHMAYCETCRAEVAKLERIGGSLLQELAPAPMTGPEGKALERLFRRSCPLGQHQMADCDGTLIDVTAE